MRSELLGPLQTQGEGLIAQGCEHGEMDTIGGHLRGGYAALYLHISNNGNDRR